MFRIRKKDERIRQKSTRGRQGRGERGHETGNKWKGLNTNWVRKNRGIGNGVQKRDSGKTGVKSKVQ